MKIERISKDEYTNLSDVFQVSFMQSSEWGVFKKSSSDYEVEHFIVIEDGRTLGIFQLLTRKIFGIFQIAYAPRVSFSTDNTQKFGYCLRNLGYDLLLWEGDSTYGGDFKESQIGFPTNIELQPHSTIIKDLHEDIEKSIPSKNARRNIKRGLKKLEENGLEFSVVSKLNEEELKKVYDLIKLVGSDKDFNVRSFEYYRLLQEKVKNTIWFIFRKKSDQSIVLANLGVLYKDSYLDFFVGKQPDYDRDYLSYVLKYNSFEWLKENGYLLYDHWGYEEDPNSPKRNYSVFKEHFGGKVIKYPKIRVISKYPEFIARIAINLFGNKL